MLDFIEERKSDRDPPMTLANAARPAHRVVEGLSASG
jgi:hypothetical protein